MSDTDNLGHRIKLTIGILGLAFLGVWLGLRYHFIAMHEELWRLNPGQEQVMERNDEAWQSFFLHLSLPMIVLGIDALWPWASELRPKRRRDKLFYVAPRKRTKPKDLPLLITSDIDACLTPPARGLMRLRNTHKLRQYCDFARTDHSYPPFILVSARSQEYTELMCQMLGLIDEKRDIPCVLENGMAIYLPYARTIEEIPAAAAAKPMMDTVKALLMKQLAAYEFEPKQFMITVNVEKQRASYQDNMLLRKKAVSDLQELVVQELRSALPSYLPQLAISSTSNAVDIVPITVNKLAGLEYVMSCYAKNRTDAITLEQIASIGNSEADAPLLQAVGHPFCSEQEADRTLRGIVYAKAKDNVLAEPNSSAVVAMIERVTNLTLR